jgi:Na+-transporting NADH:ubiquinone oxidoreductase subunit F
VLYAVSLAVFLGVILLLVGALLLVEALVLPRGARRIVVNGDASRPVLASAGTTLLASLVQNGILLPSACGGRGTCALCKCRVESGVQGVLPTEAVHLSRRERLENVHLACQVKVKGDMQVAVPEEVFHIGRFNATVVSNDNVATFIKELQLALDPGERLVFRPGSYVQIDIPAFHIAFRQIEVGEGYRDAWDRMGLWELEARNDTPVYRAYSMANTPEEDLIRFTIRIATPPPGVADAPPGVASSYLFHLKSGDRVTLSGPFGDFFVKQTAREMCFIGGGAGMAPMRSHIFHQLLAVATQRKVTFWYGARSRREMIYDAAFRALAERFPNFRYHVALSEPQPEDRWEGLTGFIHQCVREQYLEEHPDPGEIEYYLCGPPPMIAAVKRMLDDLGVDPGMIAFDDFG